MVARKEGPTSSGPHSWLIEIAPGRCGQRFSGLVGGLMMCAVSPRLQIATTLPPNLLVSEYRRNVAA